MLIVTFSSFAGWPKEGGVRHVRRNMMAERRIAKLGQPSGPVCYLVAYPDLHSRLQIDAFLA